MTEGQTPTDPTQGARAAGTGCGIAIATIVVAVVLVIAAAFLIEALDGGDDETRGSVEVSQLA